MRSVATLSAAASEPVSFASRRNYPDLFLRYGFSKFSRGNNFLSQRFEARITMERSQQRIDANRSDIKAIVVAITLFEPIHRFIAITQAHINEGEPVSGRVTLLSILAQSLQAFYR